MTFGLIRAAFMLLGAVLGYQIGGLFPSHGDVSAWIGSGVGVAATVLFVWLEARVQQVSLRGLSLVAFGLFVGLLLSRLVGETVALVAMPTELLGTIRTVSTVLICYFSVALTLRGRDEFKLIIPYVRLSRQDQREELFILDTSVIIDGRIADIVATRFVEGKFVVPRFVLRELQGIADSTDPLKRNRGRRGLDVLNKLRKSEHIDVMIHEQDFPEIREVDAKLVRLGQVLAARVLTNDFNLNKVAEIQGVVVLNINELANALKPVLLPGEMLEVKLVREGKEPNQGVAYLDDGTMVVVENGKPLIGQTSRVVVTSVLQTAAGRLIFTHPESHDTRHQRTSP